MEIVPGEDLAQRYAELIGRAAHDERIIISLAGQQVALVSFDDLVILEDLDREQDRQDVEMIRQRMSDPLDVAIPFVPGLSLNEAAS